MILKPNDIMQEGDVIHDFLGSIKVFESTGLPVGGLVVERPETPDTSSERDAINPLIDSIEEDFRQQDRDIAELRRSKIFLLHEIAKLCKENFALFKAYQVLFDHNEKANARIEYLEAMREPCLKREEDDDPDEDELTSWRRNYKRVKYSKEEDELANNAGWLGTYEHADHCTED